MKVGDSFGRGLKRANRRVETHIQNRSTIGTQVGRFRLGVTLEHSPKIPTLHKSSRSGIYIRNLLFLQKDMFADIIVADGLSRIGDGFEHVDSADWNELSAREDHSRPPRETARDLTSTTEKRRFGSLSPTDSPSHDGRPASHCESVRKTGRPDDGFVRGRHRCVS